MINIESLPKVIEYNDNHYSLQLHVTAWNKLCVCYKSMFKIDDPFSNKTTLFSEVVEKQMSKDKVDIEFYRDHLNPVNTADVPDIETAFEILKVRLDASLERKETKIAYE